MSGTAERMLESGTQFRDGQGKMTWLGDGTTEVSMNATPQHPSKPGRALEEVAKDLPDRERRLLERVLKEHPQLTPEEALRYLREAGM